MCCRSAVKRGRSQNFEFTNVFIVIFSSDSCFNVSIAVDYSPPPDFTLPSPPYYRPASSVTLTCVVHEAIEPVQYQWSSTANSSFFDQRSASVTIDILTLSDAGIHTCSVTDGNGDVVKTSTVMELISKFLAIMM